MQNENIQKAIANLNDRLATLRREVELLRKQSHLANKRRQSKLDRVDLMAMELSLDIAKLEDEVIKYEAGARALGERTESDDL